MLLTAWTTIDVVFPAMFVGFARVLAKPVEHQRDLLGRHTLPDHLLLEFGLQGVEVSAASPPSCLPGRTRTSPNLDCRLAERSRRPNCTCPGRRRKEQVASIARAELGRGRAGLAYTERLADFRAQAPRKVAN